MVMSVVADCGATQPDQSAAIAAAHLPSTVTQVIMVTSEAPACTVGAVSLYTKAAQWMKALGPFPAVLGRNGIAAIGSKHEGDGKTPAGAYAIGTAFGYDAKADTAMPYRQTTAEDVWIDDPSAADYNTWVTRARTHASSYEQLRRDDGLYELGLVIEYNTHPVKPGAGSAIFMHVWGDAQHATAGCVALGKAALQAIVSHLDPKRAPHVIIVSRVMRP